MIDRKFNELLEGVLNRACCYEKDEPEDAGGDVEEIYFLYDEDDEEYLNVGKGTKEDGTKFISLCFVRNPENVIEVVFKENSKVSFLLMDMMTGVSHEFLETDNSEVKDLVSFINRYLFYWGIYGELLNISEIIEIEDNMILCKVEICVENEDGDGCVEDFIVSTHTALELAVSAQIAQIL